MMDDTEIKMQLIEALLAEMGQSTANRLKSKKMPMEMEVEKPVGELDMKLEKSMDMAPPEENKMDDMAEEEEDEEEAEF